MFTDDPTSIQLYIDDRLIQYDGEQVQFDDVAFHNVTCIASGGNPQPVISLGFGNDDLSPATVSTCRVENNMEASFLAHVTCTSTASVFDMPIDYTVSGLLLRCVARSAGSVSPPLTMSSTVTVAGGQHFLDQLHIQRIWAVYKSVLLRNFCYCFSSFKMLDYSSLRWMIIEKCTDIKLAAEHM